jgi:hypothetical protein
VVFIFSLYLLSYHVTMRAKGKVKIEWSAQFAYAIGLLATDGCLSKNGRHISFVSKDKEQIDNFLAGLKIENHVGISISGTGIPAYRIQFSDVLFYDFLNVIGLFMAKSKTIGKLDIPDEFFFDFLRGCFDGDGTVYSYWGKRWRSSFMYYISFATASYDFMFWLRSTIQERLGILGHVKKDGKGSTYQLTYAKSDSSKIIEKMYENPHSLSLSRKKLKIAAILDIVHKQNTER